MRRRKYTFQLDMNEYGYQTATCAVLPDFVHRYEDKETVAAIGPPLLKYLKENQGLRFATIKGWWYYPKRSEAIVIIA